MSEKNLNIENYKRKILEILTIEDLKGTFGIKYIDLFGQLETDECDNEIIFANAMQQLLKENLILKQNFNEEIANFFLITEEGKEYLEQPF